MLCSSLTSLTQRAWRADEARLREAFIALWQKWLRDHGQPQCSPPLERAVEKHRSDWMRSGGGGSGSGGRRCGVSMIAAHASPRPCCQSKRSQRAALRRNHIGNARMRQCPPAT